MKKQILLISLAVSALLLSGCVVGNNNANNSSSSTSSSSSSSTSSSQNVTLESISISGTPTTSSYTANQVFDPSGLSVSGHYSDSSSADISVDSCKWVDSTSQSKYLSQGTTSVTCTYSGKTTSYSGINVGAAGLDEWTIMIYMCGSNLESDYASSNQGLATSDLEEIASVSGQAPNVNIIVEAGGSKKWSSTYSSVIDKSYLSRFHLDDKTYVSDSYETNASMGDSSTFQNFLEWGLTSYPAQKTMVIMWNHGGAMRGVCSDELNSGVLLNSEVKAGVAAAFTSTSRSQKLEVIGYDACLMQVQDVAEFNSPYFNYMLASQESESGYGWDYDGGWIDMIYDKPNTVSTSAVLSSTVDSFIKENGGTSSNDNDQTLSFLDLNNMAAYKTAWENMASYLNSNILSSSNESNFRSLIENDVMYYADDSDVTYEDGPGSDDHTYFACYDALGFLNALEKSSAFNTGSLQGYIDAAQATFANVVVYSKCGKHAGNSNGLCMYWSGGSDSGRSTYYTASQTNFANWRTTNSTYGY